MSGIGGFMCCLESYIRRVGQYLKQVWWRVVGKSPEPQMKAAPVAVLPAPNSAVDAGQTAVTDHDPLDNTAWVNLAEACVELFSELESYQTEFDPPRREVAEHVCDRLREILVRSEVGLIEADGVFDRNFHEFVSCGAPPQTDGASVRVLTPGFHIGRRILRRAHVELVKKPSPSGV